MNFSESKKISQYIFTTLIKVLKFVQKKIYLEWNALIMQMFWGNVVFARAARATCVDQHRKLKGLASSWLRG